MRSACIMMVCLLLVGCVYEVPLATESQQDVDKALLGTWQTVEADGKVRELLVLPLGGEGVPRQLPQQGAGWDVLPRLRGPGRADAHHAVPVPGCGQR